MDVANTLQTLDRGLRALDCIAQQAAGVTIAELAEQLDVHRAIAYRIVSTLEGHGLVTRTVDGRIRLGAGVVLLAARFEPQLRAVVQPLLHELAREAAATAFVTVAQGDQCVAIMVAEPDQGLLRVGYRVGSRHPLQVGAAGIAILAGRPPRPDDPVAVIEARREGYSLTRGQLQRGAVGVAAPIRAAGNNGGFEASIGVVAMEDLDVEMAAKAVMSYARRIASSVGL